MKKSLLKKLGPVLVIGLVCVAYFLIHQLGEVKADTVPYYLKIKDGAAINSTGINLTNGPVIVEVASTSGTDFGNISKVEWKVNNLDATASSGINSKYEKENTINLVDGAVKISPQKVGIDEVYANITATDTSGTSKTYPLSFKVSSLLYINTNNGSGLEKIGTDYYQVIDSAANGFVELQQSLLFNNATLDTNPTALASVAWKSSNEDVITFGSSGQNFKINGSGLVTVTATDLTRDVKTEVSFKVLVKPTLKYGTTDITAGASISNSSSDAANPVNFQLDSNASAIHVLNWKIYDHKTNAVVDTSKISTVEGTSAASGSAIATLNVTAKKAGKYEVFTSVFDDSLYNTSILQTIQNFDTGANYKVYKPGYVHGTVTIPLNYNPTESISLLMGDEYNVFGRTNAPDDMAIQSIVDADDGGTDYQTVLDYDSTTKKFTAVGEGTVKVKVTTAPYLDYRNDNAYQIFGSRTFELDVTVSNTLVLNSTKLTMYKGTSYQLDATPNDNISWSSSNPAVATVSSTGMVKAVTAGHSTITASKVVKGVVKKVTCYITVKDAVQSMKITPSTKTLDLGEITTLYADTTPTDTSVQDINIKWTSSDESILKVKASENGNKTVIIEADKANTGTVTITALDTNSDIIASAIITVRKPVTSMKLSHSVISGKTGESTQVVAYITPTDATNQTVTWKSSDASVATVVDGKVTLVSTGKATIIATSVSDPSVTALCSVEVTVPVAGITLDSTAKSIAVGKSERITYTITPTNASNNAVTWTSTNPAVAAVSSTGYVTGVAVGQTVIIARTTDGNYMQYCTVTVTTKPTGIALDQAEITVKKDAFAYLNATLTPTNASENSIIWSSTDDKVATVTQAGKVAGKAAGTALIVAKDAAGNSAYCKVTVVESVEGITLNYSKKSMKKGNTFKLKVTFKPTTATNKKVKWSTSDKSIATIASDGTVKGMKGGVAVITAKSVDGNLADTCIVTVKESVTKIKLNQSYYKLGKGKSYTLKATVYNSTATNKTVRWKSSKPSVATVNSRGKITGKRLGYTTITAYATDGSGVEATCDVRVVNQITSISLNRTAITMVEGKSTKLTAKIKPSNATYRSGKWKSSNSSIATVSTNGTVTALTAGTATITVSAKDNSGRTATCFINVIKAVPATSVSVLSSDVTLVVGESSVLHRTVNPSNSTDTTSWYSDDKSIVTVNTKTGKITAKKPGVATITCVAGGKSDTVKVTVVGLNRTSITLEQYSTYTLAVYGVTSGINWDTMDPEVCRVDTSGKITSARIGVTYVVATVNGKKLYCRVTVVPIQ
ncbi:Ig-like domain-containing protein [Anaeromicropila herbilytica]|uniref:BIG2 domain-containing protein n=1 Tax=Anaeromicropila herbilytica TaxID=2785025 RepID=A0A7R7EK91_9FIRM|nr:Ig-like domain-containing protein [Anaeromicropila herbilytica]BCN30416.1 hypothetical protein bsdtb5_17110 [Anaeromicropila herbilytica]